MIVKQEVHKLKHYLKMIINEVLDSLNRSIKTTYPESTRYLVASEKTVQAFGPLTTFCIEIVSIDRIDKDKILACRQQLTYNESVYNKNISNNAKETARLQLLSTLFSNIFNNYEFKSIYYGIK